MKPLRLEIENLRSFKKKRVIFFDGLGLFAVIGDTGAGKTSLLEAITYALFNRTTWDGRGVKVSYFRRQEHNVGNVRVFR